MPVAAFFAYGTPSKKFIRAAANQLGDLASEPRQQFADESGAVLEAAAVLAGTCFRGEHFRQQVSMALLDVDEIGADVARAARRVHVAVLQPIELVVGDDPSVVAQRRDRET